MITIVVVALGSHHWYSTKLISASTHARTALPRVVIGLGAAAILKSSGSARRRYYSTNISRSTHTGTALPRVVIGLGAAAILKNYRHFGDTKK